MHKKIIVLVILLTVVVTGCHATVTKEEINTCEVICSTNKGVNSIVTRITDTDSCWCNNGVHIDMWQDVIEENRKVK